MTLPPLPEPAMEDVDYELWGQNVVHDALFTANQMHAYAKAYAAQEVAADRERYAELAEAGIEGTSAAYADACRTIALLIRGGPRP